MGVALHQLRLRGAWPPRQRVQLLAVADRLATHLVGNERFLSTAVLSNDGPAGAIAPAGRRVPAAHPARNLLLGVARRLGSTLVTLFGVSVIIFLVLRLLPGNAITSALGVSAGLLNHAQIVALDHYYGIGEPLAQQYVSWLHAILTGNLGVSLSSRTSVASLVGSALPVTFELAIVAMLLGLLIGVLFGVFGALRPGRAIDVSGQGVSVIGLGVPSFIIGTGIVTLLAAVFQYFPSSEPFASLTSDPWLNFQQIIFPAFTLSLGIGAAIMRTARASVLEVTGQNYVRTARGKGLSRHSVTWKHIFLNAFIPVLTMSGIQLGYLLGGTVIVEQIFVLPGLGRLLVTSINGRDFPVVQSVTLIFATGFVVVNMLVDVLYAVIDPRIRSR
jgi:peptide/nickel transport system permease protein